jgi:hypothetical protein
MAQLEELQWHCHVSEVIAADYRAAIAAQFTLLVATKERDSHHPHHDNDNRRSNAARAIHHRRKRQPLQQYPQHLTDQGG